MSKPVQMPSQLMDLVAQVGDAPTYNSYYNEDCTKRIRQLVVQLIEKRLGDSLKKTDDPVQLTNAAYPYLQAYQSGYRQALAELRDLLNR